ncbi:BEM_collapsed_G0034210.mRNA.1.CDS.1 [Saccharomyces cerevisiae]|nr:BEM_HP_G0012850.mRNA.1.CDS.1 [Saccharomyces cerevisiae]CAI5008755.1 BEM_HP_G0019240.mRNA.1.CDS.1 [Saccharomyces cerevisiae]CAI5199291.1 BEM_HP_G0097050.mRNA.1.CDS.1 [Saccharomyces cerevisiae]CAI6906604.1 BEM_HP_G0012850.mRNA.1.CDS.1 [Saccharomyces cerevisiae]CAI6925819.1 BEM_HP_G0019240.mRNA.1.CDS.1 [Saccharomyces cerevisiae]
MGYVIMTLSSARISERRAKIIYIYICISLHIKLISLSYSSLLFFPFFVCKRRRPYSLKTPPHFSFFLFPYRKNSTARTIHQINQAVALVLLCVSHHLTYLPSVPSL